MGINQRISVVYGIMGYSDPVVGIWYGSSGALPHSDVCGFGTDLGAVLAMARLWKHADDAYCNFASPAMRLHGPSGIQWHYITSAVLLNLIGISNLIGTPWAEKILAYEKFAVFLPGSWCAVYQRALRSLE